MLIKKDPAVELGRIGGDAAPAATGKRNSVVRPPVGGPRSSAVLISGVSVESEVQLVLRLCQRSEVWSSCINVPKELGLCRHGEV